MTSIPKLPDDWTPPPNPDGPVEFFRHTHPDGSRPDRFGYIGSTADGTRVEREGFVTMEEARADWLQVRGTS
jgi:hypothetical protein